MSAAGPLKERPGKAIGRLEPAVFKCEVCGKVKKRECDLRKHAKRHTRPYGCTFAHCTKRFGSRNDWKRHESSQHLLRASWRCAFARPQTSTAECSGSTATQNNGTGFGSNCGKVSSNRDDLKQHLRRRHNFADYSTEIDAVCESMHLGAEAQLRFWCGFCDAAIEQQLQRQPLAAREARAQHIGDHFDKDGCHIDDWIDVERNVMKSLLGPTSENARRSAKGDNDDDDNDDDGSDLGDDGIPTAFPSCSPLAEQGVWSWTSLPQRQQQQPASQYGNQELQSQPQGQQTQNRNCSIVEELVQTEYTSFQQPESVLDEEDAEAVSDDDGL